MVWWPEATSVDWCVHLEADDGEENKSELKGGGGARVRSQLATKDDPCISVKQNKKKGKIPLYSVRNKNNEENPQIYCKNNISWVYIHDLRGAHVVISNQIYSKTVLPVPEGHWIYPFLSLEI